MDEPLVVIHHLDGGLYRRRWVFEVKGTRITLTRYHQERLEKGTYRLIQYYDSQSPGSYGSWEWLQEQAVPWDDALEGEVALALVSRYQIGRQSDFK